jgi:hypothetical protein
VGPLTVVNSPHGVQACAGCHDHQAAAFRLTLHVVDSKGRGVDDAVQVDVHGVFTGFLGVAILICLESEVLCTWADSSVGENVVDAAVLLLSSLEQLCKVCPALHIGLHKKELALGRWCLDVTTDNRRTKGEQKLDRGKTDARRTTCGDQTSAVKLDAVLPWEALPVTTATLPLNPVRSSSLI